MKIKKKKTDKTKNRVDLKVKINLIQTLYYIITQSGTRNVPILFGNYYFNTGVVSWNVALRKYLVLSHDYFKRIL